MRSLITVCAIACVVLFAGSFASAANPGQVPHNALSQMGLAGLQPMSDLEGTSVRGKDFVAAGGFSVSVVPGSVAAQGAVAVGRNYAATSSSTYAYLSLLGHSVAFAAAGGSSTAIAH